MSKAKKGMHLKKGAKIAICLILGLCLAGYGGFNLYEIYHEAEQTKTFSDAETEKYEKEFESVTDPEIDFNEQTEETYVQPEDLVGNGQVVGVLYIPSFNNFKHCIAMGVEDNVITNYVGMYRSFGMIGQPRSNTILAAHSAMYGYSPIAYFDGINKHVNIGDEISVLWMDGNTYTYIVDDIKTGIDPKDRTAFEQPTDNESEYLTLQTCTNGDPNSRTYIRAKRNF